MNLYFLYNNIALNNGYYKRAGQLVAMAVVHEGPPPHFLSPLVLDAIVYGPDNVKVSVNDVSDESVKAQLTKVKMKSFLSYKIFV